jgi:hypothetical protein
MKKTTKRLAKQVFDKNAYEMEKVEVDLWMHGSAIVKYTLDKKKGVLIEHISLKESHAKD